MPQLTSLNLGLNSLDMIGSILEPCISNLTQLKILNLRNNNIRAFGMLSLVPVIAKLSLLENLDIGSNGIHTDGIRLLASITLPKLKTINLANNYLEKSRNQLSKYLDMIPQITSLNLSCNHITDFSKMIPCLEKMRDLRSLNLSHSRIYLPVAILIIDTIAKLLHIKEVNLSSNFIGNDGVITIIS
jgi:Leucine-rich repeat (LRR) protein